MISPEAKTNRVSVVRFMTGSGELAVCRERPDASSGYHSGY
jgi:hypothetical protein